MSDENKLEVISAEEVKAAMNSLKQDISGLKSTMDEEREATGLKIEQRADDLQKALDAVEDFSKRLEDIDRKTAQNAYVATFGQTSNELKDALESFQTGFLEFNGDSDAVERPVGTKPSVKHLVEGVFNQTGDEEAVFHAPNHIAIERLQKASDDVYATDACMRAQMDANQLQEYNRAGGAKSLKVYKRFLKVSEQFTKAATEYIDTANEVVNWIPTQYSSQLYEQVKIGLPLVNMFPEVQMTAPTMVLPLDMNDMEATRVVEAATADGGDPWSDLVFVNPGGLTSNKITLEAEKLRSRYWLSSEANEDTIIAMMPFLNRKHRRNMGEALEDAILNGQVSGLDTGGTHFTKTNPSAATDCRDCWDGLRYFASTYTPTPATSVDHSDAKPTVIALRAIRAAMGEYGVTPSALAYIMGIFGYVKLLDDANVMTLDKIGPQATVRTGVLAQVDGCDVVVSRRMPENANASGLIDGVTETRTMAIPVHTEACVLGNRRRITLGSQHHLSMDSTELVAFWRGDFQPVYPAATVPFVGNLFNIAAS